MRISRRLALGIASAATLLATAAVPAMASSTSNTPTPSDPVARTATQATLGINSICGNGGSGYCLNAWGGGGNNLPVKMYQGGVANDNYSVLALSLMCHDGHVHANAPYGPCPFESGTGLNTQMDGAAIIAIKDNRNGLCVGTTSSDVGAVEVACPDALGNGGGWGSIYATTRSTACPNSNQFFAQSRYWSNAYDAKSSLASGGNVGVQAFVAHNNSTATCWGWVIT
jgi:hypothetical protein